MKTTSKIFLICVVVTMLIQLLASTAKGDSLFRTPAKYKNLFVFRADRKLQGAKVEVYSNGDMVTTQTMQKRKLIIDFCDVKEGVYTIRVSKGDRIQEFYYNKK